MKDFCTLNIPGFSYGSVRALDKISLTIPENCFLGLIGPNGGGKSTLLKLISGLMHPLSGTIKRQPHKPFEIAYLPQRSEFDRTFPLSCGDVVAMGLWAKRGSFGRLSLSLRQNINEALSKVGLAGFEKRTLMELSGGQFQRLLFARLMVQEATVFLLDEPFAAIDLPTTRDLIKIIQNWHEEGKTIITVLHDLTIVRQVFPTTLLLARSILAYGPTADVLTPDILAQAAFHV